MKVETQGFRLSPQQRRLWQLQRPGDRPFLARCTVAVRGELEPETLRSALGEVAARLEILRTTFSVPPDGEIAEQHIGEDGPAWQDLPEADFPDLGSGPLVRASLHRTGPAEHLLRLTLPALLSDALSLDLLVRQIAAAYVARRSGEPVPEPGLQYVDIAAWQNELLEGEETEAGRSYWRERRLSRIPALPVSGGQPRPAGQLRSIDLDLGGIAERSAEIGVSLGSFLLAGWQSLLWRLGEPERGLLGVVCDGRSYDGLDEAAGLLARSVPVATCVEGEQTFRELARQVEESLAEAREWQEFFAWDSAMENDGAPPFLPVGFELTAWPAPVPAGPLTFEVLRREADIDRFHLLLRASDGAGGLRAGIWYDEGVLTSWQAAQLAGQLRTLLLDALERPERTVAELEILTPSERHRLLRELVGTPVAGSAGRCLHELFEAQARRTPDQPAVACAGRQLTYAELSARSRALARRLRRLGVGPEVCAAVALERSVDMVAALLGVLQAGGAYVPLDPALPAERLALMLEDTDAAVLITQEDLRPSLPQWHTVLMLDGDVDDQEGEWEPSGVTADNLAYVLFTSGSTGRPKGVGVAHRQLVHYTENVRVSLDLPPGASFAMVSTIAADLGNTAIYPTLCSGGCLHLLTTEQTTDPHAFQDYLATHAIDCLKIVPSHLQALQSTDWPERALPRRRLVVGGESSSPKWIAETRALAPECRIYNHYGPTETTVGVLTCHLAPVPGEAPERISLGRPIGDTRIYLVDAGLRPVPVGARGELLVGGSNVSRGYVGRPAETAAKFIPDPFGDAPGERLYRTGDLARLRPDGQLEFLGRIDSQIKLRGFRIELGEIEAALRREAGVREAVVALRPDPAGNQRLVAWVTAEPGVAIETLDADVLRDALLARLPEPMVPSAFVRLDALPVTPNGKIDRRALPEPKPEKRRADLVAPRTPIERALAEIFQEVLRLAQVGVHDNFFQIGGDSILSIQVVARASRRGLRLTSQQIFEHQTIAELAPRTEAAGALQAEQGAVTGPVPLTPIQSRFLSQGRTDPHHYNQAVLLTPLQPLRPAVLEAALHGLLRHHDALRLRFTPGAAGWQQAGGEIAAAGNPLLRLDLTALSNDDRERAWLAAAEAFQAGFDLGRGPLFRALWGELGPSPAETRLLIAAHHLVVDGVSWRILLEDLERGYGSAPLPPKTTSFKHWAERLRELAGSERLLAEAPFWRSALEPPPAPLPVEETEGRNDEASVRTVRISLDAASTRALLQEVHAPYNTRINDLLLTGLAQAFARWTGSSDLLVELEGHGREDALFDDVDLSRTVGWFTAIFPVRLRLADPAGTADPARSLKAVKEQLRTIPRGGVGYGVLRELGEGEVGERLRGLPGGQVVFNYLGQFDQAAAESQLFAPGAAPLGAQRSPRGERRYLLEISAQVTGGQLHVDWAYSRNLHSQTAIERLATGYRDALQELIAHCLSPEAGGPTPSDFPLARLDQRQLDQLLGSEWRQVEDVYPLSPMQQSLLFYALHNPGSPVGVEQMSFTLAGDLDRALFWKAWQQVVDRLPILRTGFVWEGVREALQVVRRGATLPYLEEDWRGVPADEQDRLLPDFLHRERERGLDLKRPPLMRLALVRLAETTWRFVSTRHHLILDGWSGMQLLQQAFSAYEALRAGAEPRWEPVEPYRRYIAWLQEQDLAEAEAFWRRRLQGFTEPTPLPVDHPAAGLAPPETGHEHLQIPEATTGALERLGRESRLTLNVLVQGAWALLLSHWSGRHDVVFGSTVSGRPATLPGVESIVGLFINNLPVRAQVDPGRPAIGWLQDFQQRMMEAGAYDYTPPERVQEWSEVPRVRRLFETLCVFENYPMDDPAEAEAASSLAMRDLRAPVKTSYLLTLVAVPGRALDLSLAYDRRRLEAPTVRRLLADLGMLLERLIGLIHDAEQPLSALLAALPEPPLAVQAPEPVQRGAYVAPREPLERALAEIFEEVLDLRPIGATDDFFALGGTSLLCLSLMRRIQERLGRDLPLPSLVGGATVEQLAATLRRHAAGWERRALLPLQPPARTEPERLPFFCVHSAGGMVLNLLELARALGEDQPVYALQDPAFLADEPPAAGVEKMAANYLAELRAVQPAGPYRLGGHSFGGVVAFEMAQQLRRQGEEVELVALLDSGAPGRLAELADDAHVLAHISEILGRFYGQSLAVSVEELTGLAPEEQLERVLDRLRALPEQAGADPAHFARFIRLYKHHMASSRRYRPETYDGPLTLFRAAEANANDPETAALRSDRTLGWSALSALPVAVIEVPGDHTTMLSPPHVAHLAARLRGCLQESGDELVPSISLPMSEEHELRPQG